MSNLQLLAELGLKYGPFLFAVLLVTHFAGKMHKQYLEVSTRTKPPPRDDELRARKIAFYSTLGFGFVLIGVCVIWWLFNNPPRQVTVLRFTILGIDKDIESLQPRSDDMYVRRRNAAGLENAVLEDVDFIVPSGDQLAAVGIFIGYLNSDNQIDTIFHLSPNDLPDKTFEVHIDGGQAILREFQPDEDHVNPP